MTEPIPIGAPQGSYLGCVSFFRMPDGKIRAQLDDMPPSVIEQRATVCERFSDIAEWCFKGAFSFLDQGKQFGDERHDRG